MHRGENCSGQYASGTDDRRGFPGATLHKVHHGVWYYLFSLSLTHSLLEVHRRGGHCTGAPEEREAGGGGGGETARKSRWLPGERVVRREACEGERARKIKVHCECSGRGTGAVQGVSRAPQRRRRRRRFLFLINTNNTHARTHAHAANACV